MTEPFPLALDESVRLATQVVAQRFSSPVAAWLGGSVVRGTATALSDLDITVLLGGPPAPMRESLRADGVPVELFVHTESSLAFYRATDQDRRQPTMQRLVGESVVLVDRDGSGERLRRDCLHEIAAGPKPLSQGETEHQRYGLTDLIDDLEGAEYNAYLAFYVYEKATRFLLAHDRAWQGTGKGLEAAVAEWAKTRPEPWTRWRQDWQAAWDGADQIAVVRLARRALDHCGGPLWEGHRVEGTTG